MAWHLSQALLEGYASWPSSRGGEEGSLADPSSDGGPCAPWRSTLFAPDDSCSDRMKATCHRSPFGMMFVPSTDAHGVAVLTSFLAGFHARTSVQRDAGRGSPEADRASGGSSLASFARYDPATCSWRTAQCSLFGGSTLYSGTWPRWGSMRSGACWARSRPGRPIAGSGSGSLEATYPTPCAIDTAGQKHCNGGGNVKKWGGINFLGGMAAAGWWPTVTRADGGGGPGHSGRKGGYNLRTEVQQLEDKRTFPTPCASDYKGPNMLALGKERHATDDDLPTRVGGALNPAWVEWLMGWVPGFTSHGPLDTIMVKIWKGMNHDEIWRSQGSTEKISSKRMPCVWFNNEDSPAPSGHGSNEQQPGQCASSMYQMSCEGSCINGKRKECAFSAMCCLREDFSPKTISQRDRLFSELSCGNGEDQCLEKMGGTQQDGNLCLLRDAIHAKASETKNLLSFLWKQASLGATWWAVDPADVDSEGTALVPRVIAKCDKRPARIRALGNGQVPACVVLAWKVLKDRA